jgi:hypothetical protein
MLMQALTAPVVSEALGRSFGRPQGFVVETCLNPSEHTNHVVQFLQVFILEEARLFGQSVLFDEPKHEQEVIRRRSKRQGFLAGEVVVVGGTIGNEAALLTTIDCSWPFGVLGCLTEILDSGAKQGTIGSAKLSGDFLDCPAHFRARLRNSFLGTIP